MTWENTDGRHGCDATGAFAEPGSADEVGCGFPGADQNLAFGYRGCIEPMDGAGAMPGRPMTGSGPGTLRVTARRGPG